MACFLVDFENECGNLLNGISHLNFSKNDEIIIFYSKNASHLTMELHKELEIIKANKQYIKVETGSKNALDFQLSSYLGACIQKGPKKKYYIVSKDSGFDTVCRFWRDNNIFVKRIEQFSQERLTNDIADAILNNLHAKGAIVLCEGDARCELLQRSHPSSRSCR